MVLVMATTVPLCGLVELHHRCTITSQAREESKSFGAGVELEYGAGGGRYSRLTDSDVYDQKPHSPIQHAANNSTVHDKNPALPPSDAQLKRMCGYGYDW